MLTIFATCPERGLERLTTQEETATALARPGAVVWVDIARQTPEADAMLAGVFGFHPLAIEDVYKDEHRPKVEDYDRYVYIIAQALRGDANWDLQDVQFQELDLFLGKNFVVTHHGEPLKAISDVQEELPRRPELLSRGAVFLAHSILDRVVDRFLPLATAYDGVIERLEREVFTGKGAGLLEEILALTRGIQQVRRMGVQQRDVLGRLAKAEFDEIPPEAKPFYRDVHEHFAQFMETLDNERDELSQVFGAFHSLAGYRLNEVMKTLTVVSTVILPLTFLSGVYGMNFHHMPELDWSWSYPAFWLLAAALTGGQVYALRRRGWL